jgi:hypothetical protein
MKIMTTDEVLALLRKKGGVQEWNTYYEWYAHVPIEHQFDLSGADLSGLNLGGVNFYLVNLSGANLTRTNLALAQLDVADLSGANLAQACLAEARLLNTNLTGADLAGADLAGVKVSAHTLIEGIIGLSPDQQGDLERRLSSAKRSFDRAEKRRRRGD